jgi:hypothetical protein
VLFFEWNKRSTGFKHAVDIFYFCRYDLHGDKSIIKARPAGSLAITPNNVQTQ